MLSLQVFAHRCEAGNGFDVLKEVRFPAVRSPVGCWLDFLMGAAGSHSIGLTRTVQAPVFRKYR